MFGLNEIIAINNIAEAKKRFNKGGLNVTVHMGFGTKTYPADQENLLKKSLKKIKKK